MDVLSLIIAILLIFLLVSGSFPSAARKSPHRSYIRLYIRSIFSSWLLLGVVGIIVLHDTQSFASIGLQIPHIWWPTLLSLIGVCILFYGLMMVHLRLIKDKAWMADWAKKRRRLAIPRTFSERLVWVGFSINTGIWEEIVFRGFLPWYLHRLTFFGFSIPFLWAALFSLILFSVLHLYQGWEGVLGVGFIAILFVLLYAITGNLLASMLWHALFDVRFSFGSPSPEDLTQSAREEEKMKAISAFSLQTSPALPLPQPLQSTPLQKQTRNKHDQPTQRVPYYARRSPPYPHIRAARHQQHDPR